MEITLNQIIADEYGDEEVDKIVRLLASDSLYSGFSKSIEIINQHLSHAKQELKSYSILQVTHIAMYLVVEVNSRISKSGDKAENEILYSSLAKSLISRLVEVHSDKQKGPFVKALFQTLVDTCNLHNYNIDELIRLLNLETLATQNLVREAGSDIVSINNYNDLPGYTWPGDSDKKRVFQAVLLELNICIYPEEFMKLFQVPSKNLGIKFNEDNPAYVLQFFCCLNDSKLVSFHGCKGFYQVLQTHVRNFDELFLLNKTPQRRMDGVRKLKSFNANKEKFDRYLRQCS